MMDFVDMSKSVSHKAADATCNENNHTVLKHTQAGSSMLQDKIQIVEKKFHSLCKEIDVNCKVYQLIFWRKLQK